jgi:prepilin-type N-terminal cleavage/methylation domain-containing protein
MPKQVLPSCERSEPWLVPGATDDDNVSQVHRRSRRQRGFTLVELLVVTAMMGLLMALTLPAIFN